MVAPAIAELASTEPPAHHQMEASSTALLSEQQRNDVTPESSAPQPKHHNTAASVPQQPPMDNPTNSQKMMQVEAQLAECVKKLEAAEKANARSTQRFKVLRKEMNAEMKRTLAAATDSTELDKATSAAVAIFAAKHKKQEERAPVQRVRLAVVGVH